MKVSTAGALTFLIGLTGCLAHAGITFITVLGSNLASTSDDRVPDLANSLWAIALYGTVAAPVALIALLVWWTRPLALIYVLVWITLIGCYWAGRIINDGRWLDTPVFLLLEAGLPLISVALSLYGVWKYRSARG